MDIREIEGQIKALKDLIPTPVAEMANMDYQQELYRTFDGIRDRLAELEQQLKRLEASYE